MASARDSGQAVTTGDNVTGRAGDPVEMSNSTIGTDTTLSEALSNILVVHDGRTSRETERQGNGQNVTQSEAPHLAGGIDGSAVITSTPLDSALVEAMHVARDKTFVLQYEKDMQENIRDADMRAWELPLMNSYQRLLVHRMADHFRLAHAIDPSTKRVTLSKTDDTCLPLKSIATLAESERMSEPAAYPPLLNSLSGQSTPSTGAPSGSGTPGVPASIRIMRRPDGTSRSDSPRNGTGTPEDGAGMRRDRRNMTIEEREAAYQEARQRIFGSEAVANEEGQPVASDVDSSQALSEADITSGSTTSTSITGQARRGLQSTSDSGVGPSRNVSRLDEATSGETTNLPLSSTPYMAYDPMARSPMPMMPGHPYSPMDHQQQAGTYYTPAGAYPSGPVPLDPQGRPMMMMMMVGQQWTYATQPYANGVPMAYGYAPSPTMTGSMQSPAASSRSTSISAETEGGESAQSGTSELNGQGYEQQQQPSSASSSSSRASSFQGLSINRSNSVSPTVAFQPPPQHQQQYFGATSPGANGPPGSVAYLPQGVAPGGPWPVMYGHPGNLRNYPGATPYTPPAIDLASAIRQGSRQLSNGGGPSHQAMPMSSGGGSGYGGGYGRASFPQQTSTPPNGGAAGAHPYFAGPSYQVAGIPNGGEHLGAHLPPYGGGGSGGRGRGRSSQGSERSLYDPNKPMGAAANTNQSSSTPPPSAGRHSLGKSVSAAAVMENGGAPPLTRRDGLPLTPSGTSGTPLRSPSVTSPGYGARNGSSSSSSSMRSSSGMSSAHPISSTFTPSAHAGLPARPDWAMISRQTSNSGSHASPRDTIASTSVTLSQHTSNGSGNSTPSTPLHDVGGETVDKDTGATVTAPTDAPSNTTEGDAETSSMHVA